MISNYPITFDETSQKNKTKTFNPADFTANDKNASVADLKNYAHKYKQNLFTDTNYFHNILVHSINGVSDTILSFLETVSENVQDAIDYCRSSIVEIQRITTNMEYIDEDDMTTISSNVRMERLTIENNLNAKSLVLTDHLNVNHINNSSMLSRLVTTQELNCENIRCRNIVASNDVSVYIYYNNMTIPMQKSNAVRNILPDATSPFNCTLTIKQNYRVEFLDAANNRLFQLHNDYPTSNDFSYNLPVSLPVKPYKINIYCMNVLLK
jgi:hypothetical protein